MRALVLTLFVTACTRTAAVVEGAPTTPVPIVGAASSPSVDASTNDAFDAADAADSTKATRTAHVEIMPSGGGWEPLVNRDEVVVKPEEQVVTVVAIGGPRVDRTIAGLRAGGRAC